MARLNRLWAIYVGLVDFSQRPYYMHCSAFNDQHLSGFLCFENRKLVFVVMKCAEQAEELLLSGDNVEFAMAQLKLLGWEDKVEVDIAFK